MKSPINGAPMRLITNNSTVIILGKEVEYQHKAFLCEESGLTFTTTEQDTYNMERATEAYQKLIQSTNNKSFKYWMITTAIILGALLIAYLL